jgi:hypothetical protein
MNPRKAINLLFALALGLAIFIPAARADVWQDQQTQLTFNKPIRVSESIVLPAGTFTFRLAGESSASPLDVVEILDSNGKHLATVMTQPTERPLPHYHFRDKTRTNADYSRTRLNLAQGSDQDTLLNWFYPGERIGHKFLYSEQRQQSLSQQPTVTMMVAN